MTKTFVLFVMISLLPGCVFLHQSQSAAIYDFGVQPATHTQPVPGQAQQLRKSLLVADATAPIWLDNTAIHYRLLYHNPAQSYAYANSRWIATPAALFTRQLRHRIVTSTQEQIINDSSIATADHVLHTQLEEFSQVFDTATDSRIVIGLRASLIERSTRKLLAQKDFSITEKTPSADAAGAVFALSSASNQLLNELVDWLAAALPRN